VEEIYRIGGGYGMTRLCTVCQHKQVEEINKLLINGAPNRRIASQFNLVETSIRRHKDKHIPEFLLKSKEISDLAQADNLAHYLNVEYQDIKNIKQQALDQGDNDLALKAIDRSLKTIEIVAKVMGLIQEQQININNQINVLQLPEWIDLRTRIVKALEPYPQAREAVVNAIK
jgi:hypothetical protein